jgi:hypothetical protein
MNAEPASPKIFARIINAGAVAAIAIMFAAAPRSSPAFAGAATAQWTQCKPEESATVARILAESGAARELYDAADRDKTEAQQRYSLDQAQRLMAAGDNTGAHFLLESRRNLLDRASGEIDRAQTMADRIRTEFTSLSLGCRQAMTASASH